MIKVLLLLIFTLNCLASTINEKAGLMMRVIDRYCDQEMTKDVEEVGGYSKIKFSCKKGIIVEIILNSEARRLIKAELREKGSQHSLVTLDSREDLASRVAGPVRRVSNQLLAIYDFSKEKQKKAKKEAEVINRVLSPTPEDPKASSKIKDLLD